MAEAAIGAEEEGFLNCRAVELLRTAVADIRNSLGALTNGLEVLYFQGEGGAASNRRSVDLMNWQCRQMTQSLDRVMEVVRISSGYTALSTETVTLGDLVDAFLSEARVLLADRRVDVAIEVPGGPVWLEVDRPRLAFALGKLFGRATRSLRAGRGLRIRGLAGPGSVRLDVGPAEAGNSSEPGPAPRPERADLDASLARCLVEQHGGAFDLLPGGFAVELPRLAADGASGLTEVVLIDANRERGRLLGELLQRARFQVRVCEAVDEAAEVIEARPVAAVVADLDTFSGQARHAEGLLARMRAAGVARVIGLGEGDDLPAVGPLFDELLTRPIQFQRLEQAVRA